MIYYLWIIHGYITTDLWIKEPHQIKNECNVNISQFIDINTFNLDIQITNDQNGYPVYQQASWLLLAKR